MGVIARIKRMLEHRIPGYEHLARLSPDDEPVLAETRLPVSRIVRDLEWCTRLDLIEPLLTILGNPRITRPMIEEAIRYYQNNKSEIDRYIAESMARSGMIIKDGKVIRPPGKY